MHSAPPAVVSTQIFQQLGMPSNDSARPPAKTQSKWSPEEDTLIIELRGKGMKWEDISKRLPGRSAISCRLHYQNYLERRSEWDEERKNKLARLYERQVRSIELQGVMTIHLLGFPLTRTKLTELQVQARDVGQSCRRDGSPMAGS
jgi:hypothetical protein